MPLSLPAVIENIVIRINDENLFLRGEVVGSHYISISGLLKKEGKSGKDINQSHIPKHHKLTLNELQWVNFYGPQL